MTRRELRSAVRWGAVMVIVVMAAYMAGWVVVCG